MKRKIIMAWVLSCGLWAQAEKLPVNDFCYAGPFALQTPYQIDSVDVNQNSFSIDGLLDTPLSFQSLRLEPQQLDALPGKSNGHALHLASFQIENRLFAEVEIQVEGVKHFHIYIDGKRAGSGKQKLEPATHEVIIKYLTESDNTDQPKVSIESEQTKGLSLRAQGQRMYTLDDVMHGTRLGGSSISPDGKFLITTYQNRMSGGRSNSITQVTEVSTNKIVAERNERLRWMPRTTAYYYTRQGQKGTELVVVNPSNSTEQVVAEDLPGGSFQWAPTEDYLLFTLSKEGPKEDPGVYEVIVPDDRQPGWRNRSYLAKYDIKSGLMQPLTFGYHNTYANDISSDGRYILFSTTQERLTSRPTTLTSILKLDVKNMEAEVIVEKDGFVNHAVFSPDGSHILISGSPEALGGIGKNVKPGQTPSMVDNQLYVMRLADKHIIPVTKDFNPCVQRMTWSNADGHIYFTAENRDCIHLFRMDGKKYTIEQIAVGEEIVKSFNLASNAPMMVCYGESATNCERLYTLNTKNQKRSLVRDLNAEQMGDIAFGECKAWDFVNSRGDTICGRYYLPPHFDPEKKYPLIVNYYGGCSPTSRNFEGRYPHHAYAALGYVVYIVEPSGASGFGQEFSARHVNTAGDYVADDIIEGTRRFCQDHPFINDKKIGCIGASYGGFMTQYLQTKTDIFAAAISHAGISDHTSYWGEGYWGYSYSEVSMANSYPWTRKDLYVEHSPLYNADKIHTPLLFVHGDDDNNVPVGESIQMFTALKLLGRETAMVLVKNQDHHILEYNKRYRWQSTIFAWFAKWLQDDPAWWDSLYAPKAL